MVDKPNEEVLFYFLSNNSQTPSLAENWIAFDQNLLNIQLDFSSVSGLQKRYLWLRDDYGNLTPPYTLQTTIDRNPPTLTNFLINAGDKFTNTTTVVLSWSAIDENSGIEAYAISEDNGNSSSIDWTVFSGSNTPINYQLSQGDQLKTLTLYLRDQAGNITTRQQSIQLDQSLPLITNFQINLGEATTNSRTVQLSWSASDIDSGIDAYAVSENAANSFSVDWTVLSNANPTISYQLTQGDQLKTLTLYVRDLAGNLATQQQSIQLDTTPPALSASPTLPLYHNGDSLKLSLSVDNPEAEEFFYLLSNTNQTPSLAENWVAFQQSSLSLQLDFSEVSGLETRYLWLRDTIGNLNGPNTLQTTIDRNPPLLKDFLINSGQLFTNSNQVLLSWNATDTISQPKDFYLTQELVAPSEESDWTPISSNPVNSYPYTLTATNSDLQKLYLYIRDQAHNITQDNASIILDYGAPVGLVTLPESTNLASLPYLVLASDNLSGPARYLVTKLTGAPAEDDPNWQNFPVPPMSLDNRSLFWDNITKIDPSWLCVASADLEAFLEGRLNPNSTNSGNQLPCDDPGIASLDNFSTLLPAWDNQSFVFDNLSDPNPQNFTLWIEDQAGNIGWGYPFTIRYDNIPPDVTQLSLMDNDSAPTSAISALLELTHPNQQIGLSLLLQTTDNDSAFLLAQFDNATTPEFDDERWSPLDRLMSSSLLLDNTSTTQQQTLYLWLKDQAGNIAGMNPRTLYKAWLYDGKNRLDNQTNPRANRYAVLTLKYSVALGNYPLEQLRVLRVADNQTVEGQWNQENDSLVFWMEGPLQPEQSYQLEIQGHIDNLSIYAPQVFQFQSDNQSLDLNNGLVAYYPLDENPPIEKENEEIGIVTGNPMLSTDRFNLNNRSLNFDGNDSVQGLANSKLPTGNGSRSLCTWIQSSNPSQVSIPAKYGTDSLTCNGTNGFGIFMNQDWKLWRHCNDLSTSIIDNGKWNLHCLTYDQSNYKYFYNSDEILSAASTALNTNSSVDNLTLGSSRLAHGYYFSGKLDDVRIYDRALRNEEIQALYAIADPNPPRVTSSNPSNRSSGVGVADNITVYFDKVLDNNTINISNVELRRSDNALITGVIYADNNSLTFDPADNLSSLDNYTLFINAGIRDQLGNNLSPTQISFQTQMLGSGSSAEPFLISSEEGLRKINVNLSGHYLITSDITLTQNWEPIGWDNITPSAFTGSLIGDNHTIYNLIIDKNSSNNIGFFSELSGNITNLNFQNLIIRGRTKTGTIAGQQNPGSTISRVIIKKC